MQRGRKPSDDALHKGVIAIQDSRRKKPVSNGRWRYESMANHSVASLAASQDLGILTPAGSWHAGRSGVRSYRNTCGGIPAIGSGYALFLDCSG
jgi:hypothetical protein